MSAILDTFTIACTEWHRYRDRPHCDARRLVYAALMLRHGTDAVLRWVPAIRAVLDRVEAETQEVQDGI